MKSITKSIIRQLRASSEKNLSLNSIKMQTEKYGRERVAYIIEKIIRFANLLPKQLGELERATLMYHVVTRLIKYDHNRLNEERHSYYQAITKGTAVCIGIAELYYILCAACGIKCRIVFGFSTYSEKDDSYHAWNQVRLTMHDKKNWYMVDPTWDLCEYNREWMYFMKSDSYFQMNGHYWMKGDYEHCEINMDNTVCFSDSAIDRVVQIFREIVCEWES